METRCLEPGSFARLGAGDATVRITAKVGRGSEPRRRQSLAIKTSWRDAYRKSLASLGRPQEAVLEYPENW